MQILWYFCYGFAPRLVRHPFLYGEVPEGAGVKNMNFNETYMKDLLKQWGKHVVALILFLGLVMTYFSPAVFDGKVIMQGDNIKRPEWDQARWINTPRRHSRVSSVSGRMRCSEGCRM